MKKNLLRHLTIGLLTWGVLSCMHAAASCPIISNADPVVVEGFINKGHHRHPLWFHDGHWRIIEDEFLVKDVFSVPAFEGRRIGDPIFRPLDDIFYCAYPVQIDEYPYVRWFTIFPEEDYVLYEGARHRYHDWLVDDVRRTIDWDWDRRRHHWEEIRARWQSRQKQHLDERALEHELRHETHAMNRALHHDERALGRELRHEERALSHERYRTRLHDRAERSREVKEHK